MNQLMNQDNQRQINNDQPNTYTVNISVNTPQSTFTISVAIDPNIHFNQFIEGIKEQIFAQKMQAQYEDTIEYQMGNGSLLLSNETRTLQNLGFTNNCLLHVRLKLKGGR
ncbi:unnamed protein product (macronuclear) [Paramecium tetraurelia]|uniref:Ubiquitin-like domain-containing protein n=1 Tax=Paramecium tetraurelia TaxID=5888 RepID=A0DJE0_PARTE|nr:uncharacterized protein GSPATT00017501001 [Paramecium tetraurelia]CAK83157.1 unnamed protein product [Paramecium tetraurelia]|eukprot:XP_001450554.1 hypothetical protein (macronuclear) [Paramecium tetraurelia strain d4-2]